MPAPFAILAVANSASPAALEQCREMARSLAGTLLEPVAMSVVDPSTYGTTELFLSSADGDTAVLEPASRAPMSAAPFAYTADGRPDWGAMWEGFCELALYGGPPHRGEDGALNAPGSFGTAKGDFDALAEIKRGIWATTGLYAEPAEPGWIAVSCESTKMAAWLCATIILENVAARCADERLFLPASRDFTLKDEVKSVITVLAKTNHYWQAHAASGPRTER